jgi:DNA-binding winged helix-turn-helix (wHTH) protein
MDVPHARILTRLAASESRLIRLAAPPGYGKSRLARLFARRFEHVAFCDLRGAAGVVGFAHRALQALAAEGQDRGESPALTRLRLHAADADPATWRRAVLDAWKSRRDRALFVVENADCVAADPEVRELFGHLLAARPAQRVLLVSSREPVPLAAAPFFAPHEVAQISQDALRFEPGEAERMFEGTDLRGATVERVVRLAAGRPFVLFLLARFAHYEANFEEVVAGLGDVAPERLFEWLTGEVLRALTPDMMSAMLATAAIPRASVDDVAAATGIRNARSVLERLLRLPGFLSLEAGEYHMHALLREELRARHALELHGFILRAARENERLGEYLRAGELYTVSGDEPRAAAALERLPAAELEQPSLRLIDGLANVSRGTLCAHPKLWLATLPYRRDAVAAADLYDAGIALLRAMPAPATAVARHLGVRLAMLAHDLERLAEARALVEASLRTATPAERPEVRRAALITAALVAVKGGRLADAERYVEECDAVAGARHLRFDAERTQLALAKARLLGDWKTLLATTEEALAAAHRSGVTPRIIAAARSVASAAWLCNDDARAASAHRLLEDCADDGVRDFAAAVAAALGGFEATHDVVSARIGHVARWHAALETSDANHASALFDAAIAGLDTVENDFLRITVRVSAGLLLHTQRHRFSEARAIAQHVESPPLQASLELLCDSLGAGGSGMFALVAARVARSPLKAHRDELALDIVRGRVRRGAEVLHVADRGLELLAALALLPAGTSKDALAAAIWPELDGEAALNTLKVCVSRTRAQVGDKDVILSTKRGYVLSERVGVDIDDYERLARCVRDTARPGEPLRRHVAEAAGALLAFEGSRRTLHAHWAWFTPYQARVEALRDAFSGAATESERYLGPALVEAM